VASISKSWFNLVKHPDLWHNLYSNLGLTSMAHSNYSPKVRLGKNTQRLHVIGNWVQGSFHQYSFVAHDLGILAIAHRGDRVATGSVDKTIKLWNVKTGDLLRTFAGHEESVFCLHYDKVKVCLVN
jgi:WD40 repeat protein